MLYTNTINKRESVKLVISIINFYHFHDREKTPKWKWKHV